MKHRIKHLPVAAVTLGAALFGGVASASTSHFAELQIEEATLATLIQRQVKANPNFCPIEIPCLTNSNLICYVDHFDVGALGTLSRGATQTKHGINDDLTLFSPEVLFSQPIVVHIKTKTCAETPGCTTTTAVPLNLSIGLSVQNEDLCFQPKAIAGIPPSMMPAGLSACVGLDMSSMIDAVGQADGELSGIGLSLNSSNTRIGIRSEYGRTLSEYDAARISAWQAFLNGTLSPSANKNWSAFVHQSLVVSTVSTRFSSSLEQAGGTDLVGGLNVVWTPLGSGGARMDIDFEVDVTNTPCPNDIGADISIPVFAQLNSASNGIELHGSLNYSAHAGDLFVCGLLTGGGLLGPLAGTLGIAVGKAISIDLSNTSNGCVSDSDGNFNCDMQTHPIHVSLGFGQTASILLDEVTGSATGLSLAGPMSFNGPQGSSSNVQIVEPTFGIFGGCNSNQCGTEGGMYITGTSKLCSVVFSGDTLNVFTVTPPTELTLPADFGIKARANLTDSEVAAYNVAPYGLVTTIATANGINSYQIPPSTLLTEADRIAQCYGLQLQQSVDCLEPETPIWVNPFDRYIPDWGVQNEFDLTVVMVDARGQFMDFGLLSKATITMRTSKMTVVSASLDGELISMFGGRQLVKQAVSMDLPAARGVTASTKLQLVDIAFPRGLSQSMSIDRRLLPSGVSSAVIEVDVSIEELRGIAGKK